MPPLPLFLLRWVRAWFAKQYEMSSYKGTTSDAGTIASDLDSNTDSKSNRDPAIIDGSKLPKILIVGPSIRIMGGQAVMAKQLLDDLRSSNFNVDFLPINPKPPGPLAYAENVKILRTLVVSFFYIWSLLTRVPKYQIIHIFSASYFSFIIAQTPAIFISRMYGKKIVLNYHSGQCEDHLEKWGRIVYFILRRVDRIAVQSQYLVDVFTKHGFESTAIANVIDVRDFPFTKRETVRPRILVPRMLDPIYNVECSIRAFHCVKQQIPDAELTLLGDGPEEQHLRNVVNELQLKDVTFKGRVEREEIASVYADHDVFLNSSDIDNMPVSIIEAFSSGLPVVTTEAGGIPYMIRHGENGFLAPLNDHRALADCLLEVLGDQEKAQQIISTAHEDLKTYSWSSVARGWYDLYSSLTTPKELAA